MQFTMLLRTLEAASLAGNVLLAVGPPLGTDEVRMRRVKGRKMKNKVLSRRTSHHQRLPLFGSGYTRASGLQEQRYVGVVLEDNDSQFKCWKARQQVVVGELN